MQRIAKGRIVGLTIAIIAIGISIWFACEALRMDADFHRWMVARPMDMAIDLSQPGEFTTQFHQTCSVSHGEALHLICDLSNHSQESLVEQFKTLSGNLVVHKADGAEIIHATINNQTVHFWGGEVILAGIPPFPIGDYTATMRIESGVPELANKHQQVYVMYQLCGLEQLPAAIASAFAIAAGVVAVVSTLCVLPGLIKHGLRYGDSGEATS